MEIFEENKKKLGFGLMRLPLLDPNDAGSIDIPELKKMVDIFMQRGFTYFDTAIMYCGMKSQSAIKTALTERYPRESFCLATKLHTGYFTSAEDRERVLADQLASTGVSYFDYYLLHDMSSERRAKYEQFDCFAWMAEKKRQGIMRHIGFSFHDNSDLLNEILTEHPETEFVQLQINYLDWESEGVQSRKCYEVCKKHGKPVIVMEPVRGGTLANVPQSVEKLFRAYDEKASAASWAIRFAASHENVKIVLSGMSNTEQMLDNTGYMQDFRPLCAQEEEIVRSAVEAINASVAIPCTGCSYCTEDCPMHIAIPRYFALYNADIIEKDAVAWRPQQMYYSRLINAFGKASDCIGCGLCEEICPQHLPVREHLKTVAEHFEA